LDVADALKNFSSVQHTILQVQFLSESGTEVGKGRSEIRGKQTPGDGIRGLHQLRLHLRQKQRMQFALLPAWSINFVVLYDFST
jgi:hypothetical protein